jgi:hypothetical protein
MKRNTRNLLFIFYSLTSFINIINLIALREIKTFFINPKDSSYLYLLSLLLGNTMHKILGTSAVYWVAWFVESGMYRTAIKLK